MTTPNIKALAERIKYLSEKGDWDFYEIQELTKLQGQAHVIASALLRVMEDGENMAKELVEIQTHVNAIANKTNVNWYSSALESHRKLMEEL